jgi:hypothetical protein
VNPWGNRDLAARVYTVLDFALGNVGPIRITIPDASLASQAVGPPLNPVEMSAEGRTFPDFGKKMLARKPLGLQVVSGKDSVLGGLAVKNGKGLKTTYAALIQQAFNPQWWSGTQSVTIGANVYSQMQANFSFYWGLSIMLYMGTLVSDQTPVDRYVATRVFDLTATINNGALISDNPALLDPAVSRLAAQGVTIPWRAVALARSRAPTSSWGSICSRRRFHRRGRPGPARHGRRLRLRHISAETTSASVRNLTVRARSSTPRSGTSGSTCAWSGCSYGRPEPDACRPSPAAGAVRHGRRHLRLRHVRRERHQHRRRPRSAPTPVPVNTYDVGWYNVGVRPTAENLGIGDLDAFGKPLSWVEYFLATMANPSTKKIPGAGLICVDANGNPVVPPAAPITSVFAGEVLNPAGFPLLSGGLLPGEGTDVAGSFKTLSLRNVELNGPYFHTGGKATLRQVIDLYDDGGNFANASLSPLIRPLGLTPDQSNGLVAFLLALTDDRVMYQRAPFDHPELPIPAGQDSAGNDSITPVPGGRGGGSAALLPRLPQPEPVPAVDVSLASVASDGRALSSGSQRRTARVARRCPAAVAPATAAAVIGGGAGGMGPPRGGGGKQEQRLHRRRLFLALREDGLLVRQAELRHPHGVEAEPAHVAFLEERDGAHVGPELEGGGRPRPSDRARRPSGPASQRLAPGTKKASAPGAGAGPGRARSAW